MSSLEWLVLLDESHLNLKKLCEHMHVCSSAIVCMRKLGDNLKVGSCLLRCGPRDQTRVFKLGSRCFYLLSIILQALFFSIQDLRLRLGIEMKVTLNY